MRALALLLFLAVSAVVIYSVRVRPKSAEQPAFDLLNDDFQLDVAAQEYVWEIERRAHHLQQELGPQLDAALRSGRGDVWSRIWAPTATIEMPAGPRVHDREFMAETEFELLEVVPGIALLEESLHWFGARDGIERAHVHFRDLSPDVYGDFDGSWTGTWSIELQGRDAKGGLHDLVFRHRLRFQHLPHRPGEAQAFLAGASLLSCQSRSAAQPLFHDATAQSGLAVSMLRDSHRDGTGTFFRGTFMLDYDRDGWADVLVMDEPIVYLYRGIGGGKFEDRTVESGLLALERGTFHNTTIGDFDNDGFDDILFEVSGVPVFARAQAWRNTGSGGFELVPTAQFAVPDVGAGTVIDYDRDGLLDLYLPNSGPRHPDRENAGRWVGDRVGRPGVLLRNRGGFRFEDVTEAANASGGRREIYAVSATDIDLDGDPDLLLVNHMGENMLLENDGKGRFNERPFARSFGGFSMGLATGDLDGDGDPDAYVANMSSSAGHRIHGNLRPEDYPGGLHKLILGFFDGDEILRNTGDRSKQAGLEVVGQRTNGWAYGPALIDFDGDGLLDVYVPAGMQSVDPHEPDG